MFFEADTLDDALVQLYPALLNAPDVTASRGHNRELLGVSLKIRNPRARLSRSETRGRAFSPIGELLWYFTRRNDLDFIEPFIPFYREESEDGKTVHGGYGPRLFAQRGHDQIVNVVRTLTESPSTRRAVVQIFNAEDIERRYKEVPCTTTLQFLVRDEKVSLIATMRSNDAYKGLPHDVFCFTMIQEMVARALHRDVGEYRHFVGSMHLYDEAPAKVEGFLREGLQGRIEMPPMPEGPQWDAMQGVLAAEVRARHGEHFDADELGIDPYWADMVRLVQVFHAPGETDWISHLKARMAFRKYGMYIDSRL